MRVGLEAWLTMLIVTKGPKKLVLRTRVRDLKASVTVVFLSIPAFVDQAVFRSVSGFVYLKDLRTVNLSDFSNIGKVSVSLCVVDSVAYNKFIWNFETYPTRFYFNFSS